MTDPIWQPLILAYLACGVVYAAINLKSSVARAGARSLDGHGLSWVLIPILILSAGLWPLWMASGYLVKWWLLRHVEEEDPDEPP